MIVVFSVHLILDLKCVYFLESHWCEKHGNFLCTDGETCIHKSRVCDGVTDCQGICFVFKVPSDTNVSVERHQCRSFESRLCPLNVTIILFSASVAAVTPPVPSFLPPICSSYRAYLTLQVYRILWNINLLARYMKYLFGGGSWLRSL